MEKVGGKKITSLMELARELSTTRKEERKNNELVEFEADSCPLSADCVCSILVRLPICSLQRSNCVCKLWYDIIHNPVFTNEHLLHSELVILCQTHVLSNNATDFSVESSVPELTYLLMFSSLGSFNPPLNNRGKTSIQFMDYVDGKAVMRDFYISCLGRVVATCNGLVLIDYKRMRNGGMVVINPATRKTVFLRLGTYSPTYTNSYGFGYDPSTKEYKVVHLFDDGSGYTNCEIIIVGSRDWKMVDGPGFGLINYLGYRPVSAIGALHWLPQKLHNEYIVSMDIGKESFKTIELPTKGGVHDRIVELGDMLCFTSHEEEMFKIGIWVMKSLSEATWTRLHTVTAGYIMDMVPVSGSRSGAQIVFTREENDYICIYDFRLAAVLPIEFESSRDKSLVNNSYLPHVNSLVSWSV